MARTKNLGGVLVMTGVPPATLGQGEADDDDQGYHQEEEAVAF